MLTDLSRIVGVIDLRGVLAVAAVGGRREQYQPIGPPINGSAMAWADYLSASGVAGIYIADLDAIDSGHCSPVTERLLDRVGLPIWLDAGAAFTTTRANVKPIVASECHDSAASTSAAAISLDYRGENFLGDNESSWWSAAIDNAADVVLLDVAAVGSSQVTVVDRCRRLRSSGFTGRLLSGGGVSCDDDVNRLVDAGCDLVLAGRTLWPTSPLAPRR